MARIRRCAPLPPNTGPLSADRVRVRGNRLARSAEFPDRRFRSLRLDARNAVGKGVMVRALNRKPVLGESLSRRERVARQRRVRVARSTILKSTKSWGGL